MKESRQDRKRTLSGRFLNSLFILTIVICVCVSTLVAVLFYRNQIRLYGDTAFSVARNAAQFIDGDKVRGYLDTSETDEYYQEVQSYLENTKKEFDLMYHYVFAYEGNEVVYVWDADDAGSLGWKEESYTEEDLKIAKKVLSDDPPEDFMVTYSRQYGLCGTAWVPVRDSTGKAVAIVGVDYYMPGIFRMILIFILAVVLGVIIVTTLGGVFYYRSIKRDIIRPIELLDHAASEMVNNIDKDVDFDVDIHTGDELEGLADSFRKMDQDLRTYINELAQITAEKERIGAELSLATNIQASMLPHIFPAFPDRSEFEIYASMDPAKEVGGDFYDYFLIDNDHLGIVIADVSGKGVPAALFMMASKIILQSVAIMGYSPSETLERANNAICSNNEAQMFVTVWLGILDLKTGKLTASNAGHEFPAIRQPGGKFELYKDKHGFVIGGMKGMRYKEYEIQMEPGSKLFVYTDGVAEATSAEEELFGTDRMIDALNIDPDAAPQDILRNVRASVDAFVKEAEQFDDLTMLCVEYKGTNLPNGDRHE